MAVREGDATFTCEIGGVAAADDGATAIAFGIALLVPGCRLLAANDDPNPGTRARGVRRIRPRRRVFRPSLAKRARPIGQEPNVRPGPFRAVRVVR